MNRKGTLYLKIADMIFAIRSNNTRILAIVQKAFTGFVVKKNSDAVATNILMKNGLRTRQYDFIRPHNVSINNINNYIKVNGGSFSGWIDRELCSAEVSISENISASYLFLCFLTALLLSRKNGIMLHECSVVHDNLGYVFCGPPNIGKSTMAFLSPDKNILSDDLSIVRKIKDRYMVFPSPFWGKMVPSGKDENDFYPIKGMYFLNQADENFTRVIRSKNKKIATLHNNTLMFPLMPWHCENVFKTETEIVSEVPFFQLYFMPDKSVWRCLDVEKNVC